MAKQPTVDVIIPIQNAYQELEACIAEVRRHGGNYRLILVDEASADERIRLLFRRLSAGRVDCVLLRNARRGNRATAINLGIAHSGNDVVVLDAATRVTHGWLDKLSRCAGSDATIGIVTPFASDGEMRAFSAAEENARVPVDAERLGRAVEHGVVPLFPELPATARPCMFIRRRLIEAIGVFDAALDDGDRDAIDFCMRARKAGYRSVLCDDALVGFPVSRSVDGGAIADADSARNPDYLPVVREFVAKDPLRPVRGMIRSQAAILAGAGKPGVLHVVHVPIAICFHTVLVHRFCCWKAYPSAAIGIRQR